MLLAETVSIDGGLLLTILAVLLLAVIAWCFAVSVAFRAAKQAGRGEDGAMTRWVLAGVVEVAMVAWTPLVVVALVFLAIQVFQYRQAREAAGRTAPREPPA